MEYERKTVSLQSLYLQNDNPRHDPFDSEPEIISYLLQSEDVKALAKDIAELGETSPLDTVGVVGHPKQEDAYVVVEGNRRVCALKLLADPERADTNKNRAYFRALAAKNNVVDWDVFVVVFPGENYAQPWVDRRHDGQQGGVGLKPWNPGQKARNKEKKGISKNPDILAANLLDYASKKGLLPESDLQAVAITTLTRFLKNDVFRNTLGINSKNSLEITVPEGEFSEAAKHFINDSVHYKTEVNSRKNKSAIEKYAHRLTANRIAPTTRGQSPVDLMGHETKPDASTGAGKKRDNRSHKDRHYVVERGYSAKIDDKVTKRLYDELKKINAENFPFCANYLSRALLENATTEYLRPHNKHQGKLHIKLSSLADKLVEEGMTENEVKILRQMATDRHNWYSPDSMGHAVHGGAIPSRQKVVDFWDNLEHIFTRLFDKV